VRVFSNLGFNWPRRQTLVFVAFALIVVAFTAFALSWNGLSVFRSSANADPQPGPYALTIPGIAKPTPSPTATPPPNQRATTTTTQEATPEQSPSPTSKPTSKPAVKATTKHRVKPKAKPTPTPKPKPTHTPKPKLLYVHTPKFVHTPRRHAQYPPAPPPITHYGVLAGVAGNNYKPR
jgi:outer membrane biosynthesis protein TonB